MRGDENTSVRVIDRELLISVRHRESSKGRKWTQRQKRTPKGGVANSYRKWVETDTSKKKGSSR